MLFLSSESGTWPTMTDGQTERETNRDSCTVNKGHKDGQTEREDNRNSCTVNKGHKDGRTKGLIETAVLLTKDIIFVVPA